MASISSVITGGFGVPGSAALVITDGYGTAGVVVPPTATNIVSAGGVLFKSGKRRNKVIRYSDFESIEAYAQALQAAIPMSEVKPIKTIERTLADEEEDEEIILMLMKVLH